MAKRRKRNDTHVTWPFWLLGSVLAIGGVAGANYGVHWIANRGKPRWKFWIRDLGGIDKPVGYEIVVADPQGKSGILRPMLEDGTYDLKSWWAARNFGRIYITCRGGVPVLQRSGAAPNASAELVDACATE